MLGGVDKVLENAFGIVAMVAMVILELICKKFNLEKLRPFTMPIAMFIGMGSAMLFEAVLPADIVNFVWR
jgi:hypothetical protein